MFTRLVPSWSGLNRAGRSRVLRSSYIWLVLVPIAAKLLTKVGPEIEIPIFLTQTTITISMGLPFSWKIFFFSSIAFSIAGLLYSLRCPKLVRDYDSYSEFLEVRQSPRLLLRTLNALQREQAGVFGFGPVTGNRIMYHFLKVIDRSEEAQEVLKGSLEGPQLFDTIIPEGKLADAFYYVRFNADFSRLLGRVACFLFYFVGFVLFSVVMIQNFLYVWSLT